MNTDKQPRYERRTRPAALVSTTDPLPPTQAPASRWGEWQPIIDAAIKSDPKLAVLLFGASGKVAADGGISIEVAAAHIKVALLDTFTQLAHFYTPAEASAIRTNLASVVPVPDL